ncbi:MAG: hypothetical protein ACI389_07485 [Methanobrevibacter sp.]|uniref:hypothetical protein n=1 Tax=Methanobrevibacter sp. TaxID=66852 RepID=UPI003F0EAE91
MHIEKQYRELEQIEEVRVYNINIVNGYSGSLGGAIYNQGNVNISNSTFKNCYSNDGGEFIIIMVILIFLILNLKSAMQIDMLV